MKNTDCSCWKELARIKYKTSDLSGFVLIFRHEFGKLTWIAVSYVFTGPESNFPTCLWEIGVIRSDIISTCKLKLLIFRG